jgi:hypothetical protein
MRRLTIAVGLAVVCLLATSASAGAELATGEFTASRTPVPCTETTLCTTRGISIESQGAKEFLAGKRNQRLRFGPFEIYCAAKGHAFTMGEGAISWEFSQIFATEDVFSECLTKYKLQGFTGGITTVFVNAETKKTPAPIKIIYKRNGTAEFGAGETTEEAEIFPGAIQIKISGKTCEIEWPSQKVPLTPQSVKAEEEVKSFAIYSQNNVTVPISKNFPTGVQKKLVIHSHFGKMEWKDLSGQCLGEGGFEKEAKETSSKNGVYEGSLEYYIPNGNLGFE